MPRKLRIPVIRWIARARVPMPSSKDYIARPAWQTDVDVDPKKKKTVSFMATKGSVRRFYMGVHGTVSSSGLWFTLRELMVSRIGPKRCTSNSNGVIGPINDPTATCIF